MVQMIDQEDYEIIRADHVIHFEHGERQPAGHSSYGRRGNLCHFLNIHEHNCKIKSTLDNFRLEEMQYEQ